MADEVESLVKAWTAAYSEEVLEYASPPEIRDEEVSIHLDILNIIDLSTNIPKPFNVNYLRTLQQEKASLYGWQDHVTLLLCRFDFQGCSHSRRIL